MLADGGAGLAQLFVVGPTAAVTDVELPAWNPPATELLHAFLDRVHGSSSRLSAACGGVEDYAQKLTFLGQLVALSPSSLEQAEALEQLRWLEHGFRVRVGLTDHLSFCVDTPADLEEARRRVLLL